MQAGQPKMEQIRPSGAQCVLTACENYKNQLTDLNEHYEMGVKVRGVMDLATDALIL